MLVLSLIAYLTLNSGGNSTIIARLFGYMAWHMFSMMSLYPTFFPAKYKF